MRELKCQTATSLDLSKVLSLNNYIKLFLHWAGEGKEKYIEVYSNYKKRDGYL